MSLGTSISSADLSSCSIFSIPLQQAQLMRLEEWGQAVENTDSVSVVVGGIHQFIGDQNNRVLRCLIEADQLAESTFEVVDEDSLDHPAVQNLSPLVLYGETGTGKTSLAVSLMSRICAAKEDASTEDASTEAASQQTITNSAHAEAIYLAGSEFYRRHLAAMERQSISEFRERFLQSAGLLIDNIEQLQGKHSTERELVYLMDKLARLGKPIVVTMRRSPADVNHLSSQLLSRLAGGLSLPVLPPGLAARREIISRLSELHRIALVPEAADWIADRMVVSVPRLNQFFIQLKTRLKSLSNQQLSDKPVDMATLGLVFQQDQSTIDAMASRIVEMVSREFELTPTVVCSNSRKQTVVLARGVAVWLMRKMLGFSYHAIGKRMGNRDHTTVMHAFQKYDSLIEADSDDSDNSLGSVVRSLQLRLNDLFAGQMTLVP